MSWKSRLPLTSVIINSNKPDTELFSLILEISPEVGYLNLILFVELTEYSNSPISSGINENSFVFRPVKSISACMVLFVFGSVTVTEYSVP